MNYCTTALEIIYNDYINKPFIHSQIVLTSYDSFVIFARMINNFFWFICFSFFSWLFFLQKTEIIKGLYFLDISQFTQIVDKSFCVDRKFQVFFFRWAFMFKTINQDFITCVSQSDKCVIRQITQKKKTIHKST